jgi:hypothetical protein
LRPQKNLRSIALVVLCINQPFSNMTVDKIFYTNGNDVSVSDSMFTVKKKKYRLPGITHHSFKVLKPVRVPGLVLTGLGVIVMLMGSFRMFSSSGMQEIDYAQWMISSDLIGLVGGGIIVFAGLLVTFIVKPHYAVHISTAEGDSDVIVSKEREYVRQVVDALNRAFLASHKKK